MSEETSVKNISDAGPEVMRARRTTGPLTWPGKHLPRRSQMPSLAPANHRQGPTYVCNRQVNLLVSRPRPDSRKRVDLIATKNTAMAPRIVTGACGCH